MEETSLPHSEEEEEEEDDDPLREEQCVVIKQELQEQKIKPVLLLDETSNLSHGDESSSGFLGSPGEPDSHLSMEFGLESGAHSHADNLLTETDDSLPFEPLRSDREKVKRRGSPGRSRIKQVRSTYTNASNYNILHFQLFTYAFSCKIRAEAVVFQGGVDLVEVVEVEGVVGGPALRQWPPALMLFW